MTITFDWSLEKLRSYSIIGTLFFCVIWSIAFWEYFMLSILVNLPIDYTIVRVLAGLGTVVGPIVFSLIIFGPFGLVGYLHF